MCRFLYIQKPIHICINDNGIMYILYTYLSLSYITLVKLIFVEDLPELLKK